MAIEDNPYAEAMLSLHKQLMLDIAMLRTAFVHDGLDSGRHTLDSMADLLEHAGSFSDGYAGSPTAVVVEALRSGKTPGPNLTVIDGGKEK